MEPPASFEELAAAGADVVHWTSGRARGPVSLVAIGRLDLDDLGRNFPLLATAKISRIWPHHRRETPDSFGGFEYFNEERNLNRDPRNNFSPAGMLFKSVVAAAGTLVATYLLWKLRSLIVPVTVSSLMAYICRPLVTRLEHNRVPRSLGIWLLLFVFVLAALFIAYQVRSIMPTEIEALELKVRAIYKINEGYKNLMGLDQSLTRGNWIYRLAHDELDPIVDQINRLLALTRRAHPVPRFAPSGPRGTGRVQPFARLLSRKSPDA